MCLCLCMWVAVSHSHSWWVGGYVARFGLCVLVLGTPAETGLRAVREICVVTCGFIVILRSKLIFMVVLLAHPFSVLAELDSFIKIYLFSAFSAHSSTLHRIIVQ